MELVDPVNSVMIFVISNNLTQMVNFRTQTPNCDSHSPTRLDLFILSLVLLFFFFNCYLGVPRPTLGHSQGDSLTNLMLITAV